ncbi:hypothetical protein L596_007231 [Steinernema carpocapsae]|uniref:Uncharacterized protein n=1 Tax=Steinernema carpocapsae TaxID=34508 RepID=A0A4U5P8M2_STECR|nr:hypothetical protein L596_007231 [Steinernema carpocapsae]
MWRGSLVSVSPTLIRCRYKFIAKQRNQQHKTITTRSRQICSALREALFTAQVLSQVALVQDDDRGGVRSTTVRCTFRRDAESQRHIAHRIHHNSLVRFGSFRHSSNARLQHVVSIQKLLLRVGLEPHSPL